MTTTEVVQRANLVPVPKARNLDCIGWHDGYMVVKFKRSLDLWIYGAGIPEVKRDQILANPYPDSLFDKAIKKKYRCHKVNRATA